MSGMNENVSAGDVVIETNDDGLCVSVWINTGVGKTCVWDIHDDQEAFNTLSMIENCADRVNEEQLLRRVEKAKRQMLFWELRKRKASSKILDMLIRRGFVDDMDVDMD